MQWIAWAILILILSGIGAWVVRRGPGTAALLGAGGCIVAAALGLYGSGYSLLFRQLETRRELWNAPFASLSLGVDSLTAVFLVPIFLVGGLAALAALRRFPGDYAANRPHEHWLFFNAALAGAALAATARNAVLFLFAWELMTVASFLLIENHQRQPGARSGGWVYLTAGHLGGACLFAMFALLGSGGGFDFSALKATGWSLTAVFLLAYAGFGGKMGLAPFHAWYPESYPQAPGHVGAILSGVIGNLGLYGLMRILLLTASESPPPAWWGYLLLFSGLASGLLGAARSLAARDLFRLLAWSSLENYGLLAAGTGLGLLGAATGNAPVSYLGFAAALFHMLNHSVAKALLFLSARSVHARAGTRDINAMGGLLKLMPRTGLLFLVGAMGAAAIPPLNGFASEFLLLMAAYSGAAGYQPASIAAAVMVAAIAVLAVTGGLAVAAYMKAFGFTFLGNPRGAASASSAGERRSALIPHLILAILVIAAAALSPWILSLLRPTAEVLTGSWLRGGNIDLSGVNCWIAADPDNPFQSAWLGSWLLAGCVALAGLARMFLVRGKARASSPTWDCGYAAPDSRMQYTPASFAEPLAETFQACANLEKRETPPNGLFPAASSYSTSTPDIGRAWGFSQLFSLVNRLSARVRVLQGGKVQIYLLYMAVALIVLLLWKL